MRMATYRYPRCHLRPHRSFQNSQIRRCASREGNATAGLILGYIALVLGVMGIPLLVSMIQSDRERLHDLFH